MLNVTATGHATSAATATMLMRGADLGLTGGSEELDALALVSVYNTAPTLDSTRSPSLAAVNEDSGAPFGTVGTLVSALVDTLQPSGQNDNVTDPDTDAQLGIAVIVADTSSGSWWYSTDNGVAWNALGAVSNASAKLLAADASTRLYFRPNADFAGTVSSAITFRAWDRSVGSNGLNHNTTTNGGVTAFSADFDTAQVTVSGINDAPLRTSAAPAPIVANEDSAAGAAVTLGLGSLTYAPGGGVDEATQTLTAQITAIPASVTLWLADGTTAVPVGSTLTIAQLQGLRYRTVPDANGAALLTWTVRDSGGTAIGGVDSIADSVSITINPANDAPVLSGSNELDGINQNPPANAGTLVSELIAGRVVDADAGALGGIAVTAVDNTNGSWQYSRDGGASWTAFGAPTVGAARLLAADAGTYVRFAPNANWVGQVSAGLTFRAWDQTSGSAGATADTNANGATSAFSTALASASIQVSAWPVIFTGSYLENFTGLGANGTQMAVGYRSMVLGGTLTSYDAANPINAAGIAGSTVGNQNLLVWNEGNPSIQSTTRLANAGSIGNAADRTLATGPVNVAGSVIELAMRNATAGPLASIQFGYDLKVLANAQNGSTEASSLPGYAFFYSLTGGTSAAEWTAVPALATTATTVGSVTSVSTRIDFATPLATGATMFFRWADDNSDTLLPDQTFAIDNVSVQRINAAPTLAGIEPGALAWQEDAAATPVSSTITVADIDDADLSSARVAITANYANGQDLLVFVDQNGISGSWDAASGVLTLTGSSSLANYQAALRSVAYLNTSDAPSTASRTVTFSVRDASATSNVTSRTIDVAARNDAPVLTGSNDLPAINRNPASNAGLLVADLLVGQVADPDAISALRGIAVTAVDNGNGSWQYSTDGGSSWLALGAPSDASARLLAADAATRVRFVPATDWTGIVTDGLRFRAWDRTSGSAGAVADVQVNGGSTAFSSATAAASISVGAANTAPVLSGANAATRISEDAVGNAGTSVAALVAGRISDVDPGALAGIAVTAVDNSNGSWQYSMDGGGNWLAFGTPSGASARLLAADASTFVRFVPAADFNGTVGAGITFKAWDRSTGVAGTTTDLTSIATVRDNFSTVAYDSNDGSARWSTPWLDVDAGPVGGSYRVSGGRLEIRTNNASDSLARQVDLSGATSATLSFGYVSDLNNGSGGRIDIQVSNNGGASYTSLASFTPTLRTGTGSFSADISGWISAQTRVRFVTLGVSSSEQLQVDNLQIAWSSMGGGANAFSSASAAASIAVDAVNDAPVRSSAAPAAISAAEDSSNLSITSLGLGGLAYGAGGASDESSQTLSYTVTAVPPMITAWLADGTTPVSAGTTLTLAQLRGLSYRTEANANGSGNLTWTVRDSGGTALGGFDTLSQSLTITVTPVNDAPVVTTGAASLAYLENQAATPIDPALTLGDIDSATLASARVTIAANFAAGEDRLVFTNQNGITGSFNAATGVLNLSGVSSLANYQAALRSVGYLNTSENPSGLTRTVSFMVNDGALASAVATSNVTVSPVNDAPVTAAGGTPLAYTENQVATVIDAALTLADVDNTTLAAATVRISGNFATGEDRLVFSNQNGIAGSFDAATGVLSLSGVSSLANYQAALRSVAYLNTSDNPSGLARTVSFSVGDGALTSNVATTAVSVAPVNDAPVATAGGGSLAYMENQAASPVDPALTLADVDHASLASATVRISGNFAPGEDRLVFVDQNGISGSYDSASGILSLGGASSVANYQAALRSVAYRNLSDNPSALTRTVSFMVSDGALSSNLASRNVLVTPVNDAPVTATSGGNLAYIENQPATAIDPALTLSDHDHTTLASATVRITGNFASGEDRLVFAAQNGISGSFDAATGVLSLTGPASMAHYQAALRSVAYLNTSDDPSALARTISFMVHDGALGSNAASRNVLVTPVNDAPVTATSGGSLAYVENQTATAIDAGLTLADLDNATLASATVRISSNFASGEDRLVFADQNGISGSFDAATGVLTLTGPATVSSYQAALRSVAYLNTSDDPSAFTRTISFMVNDGALGSNWAGRDVQVTPVNDAPVTATSGGNLAYIENQSATAIDPALTLADSDHATLASATVRISGNFAPGEDRLVFADQNGISGSFDAANGTLSLAGSSSIANYQAALRSVAYLNTSDDPGALSRTVSFSVNDGALASNVANRDVTVTPVNDAPVATSSAGSAAYTENQSPVTVDPALTLGDLDDSSFASATVAITVNFTSGEDRLVFANQNGITGSFDAATGVLNLSGVSSVANYQAALRSVTYLNTSDDPSGLARTISFRVNDGALTSSAAIRNITVTPVNDAPLTATGAGSATYTENQSAVRVDPALTLADLDNAALAAATVAITGNLAAGEDRLVFANQNGIAGSFDAATGVLSLTGVSSVANYQAALRSVAYLNTSDDPSGLTRTISFSVNDGALASNVASRGVVVTPVNDAPVVATSAGTASYTENQLAVAIDPALTLGDVDNVSLASATVAITGQFSSGEDRLVFSNQNGVSGSFDAATGVLSLTGSASVADYQAALRSVAYLNTSDDPSALIRTVSFTVSDGALQSIVGSRSLAITPVNDAPVVATSAGTASYTENQSPVALDPALTLADLDDTSLVSATVAVTGNFLAGEDRLAFVDQNGISGSFDAATGVLSLSGASSLANYQSALRSIVYLNTSDDPSGLARTMSFSVHDGALQSNVATRDVVVTPVNDAPVATTSAGAASYIENQPGIAIDPALALADIDDTTLASATVAITGNFAAGEDRLVFANQNGIAGSFDAATGVLSLAGVSSVANYQAALRSVAYLNTSDDPSGLTRTISFSVNDGALASNVASRGVVVTPVNDAPVVTASAGAASYTENQLPVAIDPALTLADVDDLSLASATVAITGRFASGEDRLVFADQSGISGSFDAATGVLSLTGSASVADYQAALRSAAYLNTSDDPSALTRTVSFSVNDGALDSALASRDIGFTAVNDAPVAATGGGSLAYTENQAATAIDPALTLSDVDSTLLASATVSISGNFAAGEDRLVFADQNGISGSFDAATGVLSLSGVASVANYQDALRSVAYLNTSDDPSVLTRTVSFSVSDGALGSNVASRDVGFTALNDAPVASAGAGMMAYIENQAGTPVDPVISLADVDNTTLASAIVAISGNFAAGEDRLVFADQNGISGSFDAATGVLRLSGVASVADYQAALRSVANLNTSDDPSALTRTVSFSVNDGALDSAVATRSVGFTAVNDAPVASSGAGSLAYTENQAATPVDPALTLADLDNTTLASATVAISGNFAAGQDRLVFADQNGISGSFDAASGLLSLSGVASIADYQTALRAVAYLNTSDDPSVLTRTVSFSVDDGALGSNVASRTVAFTAVNDAPVTSPGPGSLAYIENQAATPVDPAVTLADLDNTTLESAIVTISGNFAAGEDRLVFADKNGISGHFDAATGVLSLSGVASVTDYQAALRSVAYLNTSEDPSALTRTVSFSVNDGALGSNVASRTVDFTAVNDAPVATTGAGSLAYTENQAATPVDPAISLADVDNTTLASATVAITGNFAAGEDRLVFADQNGITGSFDAATGVLRLSGGASVGDYQTALRSVAYQNTSDDPSALTRTVSFSVGDGALESAIATRSVGFTAVNDAPVAATGSGSLAYTENQAATAIDPALTLSDVDNTTLASATIAITGSFASGEDRLVFADQDGISGSFDAASGVLSLSGVASLADYQAALRSVAYLNTSDDPSALTRTVSFSVNDGALASNVASRTVGFTAVNDAPVATTGAGSLAYVENQAATPVDPAISLADVDNTTLASATVAITGNFAAGEDHLVFADQNGISGSFDAATGVLTLSGIASVADYQTALRSVAYQNTSDDPSALTRTVSFSVEDGALVSSLATRNVGFTAVNDAPVAATGSGSLAYTENQAATAIDTALTLSDVDNTTLASATIAITGNFATGEDRLVFANQNGISGSFDAASGVLSLSGVASLADYQTALRSVAYLNTSDDPSALTRTVSYSVNDGALGSNVASRTVSFTAVNDAPVAIAGAGSLAYIENQAATPVDASITLADIDNTTLASATITITGNFAAGEDRLVFADQNGITGSFDAASGVLSLSGIASVADYQAALRSVGYQNTSDDPSALTRTVSFSVGDGALESAIATRSVGFTAVNDAPVAATGSGSLAYTENQAATAIDPALTLGDVDNITLTSASVVISGNFAAGEDRLVFADQNGISGSFDAATGVLSLTGVASVADYQAALRSVAYLNTSDDPSALTRTVSFAVNDGALDSNVASRTVGFTAVNDAPVAVTGGGSLEYTENQAATPVDAAITLADIDNITLASATITVSGNFAAGEDRLVFNDQNGITGSFDAATGVLSLSGVASLADYQAALRSVGYQNTSDDPSALTRTVSFSVGDGALESAIATRSVGFTAVNDAPVAATGSGSLAYTENQAATAIDPALTLSDVDNTTLASATVAITGNFAAGEDRLVFADQNGISGSFDASSGVLRLTGVASVADYQAALRSVAYLNTSDDPSALTRTVSFSVDDGALESSIATRNVAFTAVNDAPVTTTGAGSLAYTENQLATPIDPALTLADLDNKTLASATVAITGSFATGEDRLVFTDQNGITGSFDAGTGVLTLSGVASMADYQAALRSVGYMNTSDDPSTLTRTVSFSVHDGELASTLASLDVTVTPTNDAPVVVSSAGDLAYTENQDATPIDPALSLVDLDNVTLASATVSISSNFAAGEDRLVFADQNGIVGSFDGASGVLRLSGTASVADYQAALRSVAYLNTSDDPGTLTRTVSFSVSDALLESARSSRSVSVVAVGDAPTSKPVVLASIKEDSGPRTITQSELLAAAGDLDSATLRAERLVIATGRGELVDNGDGSWTYTPAADDDTEVAFSYIVSDPVLTTAGRALLDLAPVDDAPLLALSTLPVQGGSRLVVDSKLLQANDTDNLSSTLSFVVVDTVHGRFEAVDAPGAPVERFTQSDVDAGRIALVSTSASQAPDFRIAAYDGNSYSGMIVAKIDFRRTAFASTSGDAGVVAGLPPAVLAAQPALGSETAPSAPPSSASTTSKSAQSADPAAGDRKRVGPELGDAMADPVEAADSGTRSSDRSLLPRASTAERAQRPRADAVSEAQLDLAARISVDDYVTELAEFELLDLSQQQRSSSGRGPGSDARSDASGASEETYGELDLGQAAAASGLVLSAGTIWWALRAGSLLTGLMVSLPAWRHADLLAVLPDEEDEDVWESAEDHESARDERAVDRIFESGVMGEQR